MSNNISLNLCLLNCQVSNKTKPLPFAPDCQFTAQRGADCGDGQQSALLSVPNVA